MLVAVVGVAAVRRLGDDAQAGHLADERFHPLPYDRVCERLVVETDRHQPAERLRGGKEVVIERRKRVLVPDLHPLAHGSCAGPDVRDAVHIYQAVRAPPLQAEQAARTVILEAPAEDAEAGPVQSRGYRVIRADADGFPPERGESLRRVVP